MTDMPAAPRDFLQDLIDLVQHWAFALAMVIAAAAIFHEPTLLGSKKAGFIVSTVILFGALGFLMLTGWQFLKHRKLERKTLTGSVALTLLVTGGLTFAGMALLIGGARFSDAKEFARREALAPTCQNPK